ncbi:PAS domain S-box protein [Brevundimonas sp.]|uniref:PAS domain S-box protein n=1 Tax=Brevundimonas sp. TaxID=1871086 RepID=UPI001E117177|nr:PAS domain S-box protein [Brevundimonas sp.]MBA4000253.1 PAS fold family protein [Brevundimonas sp.]
MSSGTSGAKTPEHEADRIFRRVALSRDRGPGHALLVGVAGAAVGILIRLSLQGVYGGASGLMLYLPGILVAALWAGRLAGFTALILAIATAWGMTVLPGMFPAEPLRNLVNTITFSLTAVFGIILAASLRHTLRSLDRSLTELHVSAAALDEGEARFRLVSEDAPVMLWMSDEQGDCVYLNRALREFWGAPEDLGQFDWSASLHPEDAPRVRQVAMEASMAAQGFEVEARYRRNDGQWRIVHTNARPRLDSEGRFFGMIGVNLDVTDTRMVEDALRDNEAELTAMVEQAAAGIVKADLNGRILKVNDRFCEMLGYSRDEILGKTTADITHPEDVARTGAAVRTAAVKPDGVRIEKRYRRKDGGDFWALTSVRIGRESPDTEPWLMAVVTDITDNKAAEAALRESESRFRLLADTAPAPVWLTNEEGEVEFVNEALVEFYGRPAEELRGHIWKDTLHPDDLGLVAEIQAEARTARRPYGFESRFRNASNDWCWMRVSVKPRFDTDGAFRGYVGMSFDVTETRNALDRLARDERRQTFLLALTDRLRDLDEPTEIMVAVEAALGEALEVQRVGYGEIDEDQGVVAFGRDWTDTVASAQGDWALNAFGEAVMKDLAAGAVVRISDVREDPRTRDSAATFDSIDTRALVRAPLVRGGRLRAFLYVHDAHPRKWTDAEVELIEEVADRTWAELERARAEAHLRESESRFRDIADTAPVLIWVTRADRVRSFVNQAYVEYMGADYETVRLADWREYLHPDDHERILAESLAGEATGKPFSLEARYRHNSGEYRWLRSFSRPRLDAHGEVIGFVGVAFDVNEAKRAEQDLKRINELLAEKVTEALEEKARAEQDLMHAQRMEAVGRLTGGVAHDFNNLLTVVIGALDMILKSPDDAARRQKMGEAALAAARRGERLTHQLLAFSRRQALRPEPCDLNALVRESEPLLRRALGEAIDFRTRLKRGGAFARVDAAQFEAALLNLVVNARDAMGEQGSLRITTENCDLPGGPVGVPHVCVTVKDSGEGMSDEVRDRVFEPFFTTKAVGKGTGLGLSQVYGFARQSGGDVRIESAPGKGTQVRLYLPALTLEDMGDIVATEDSAPASVSGRRVLLVEDDPAVSAVAMDLLMSFGLEVVSVENADQALTALEASAFDLMLTDIVMPGGMSGIDLARASAERWPDMHIVLTSGYAGDDVDKALKDAPWPLLPKPYASDELQRRLGEILSLD